MPLVKTTPPGEAEGKLAELYATTEQYFGAVPNNVQLLGVSPAVLENQLQMVEHYIGHPNLTMPFLAWIRLLVSNACQSEYCQNLNSGLLMQQGITGDQIQGAKSDPATAPLNDKENALLSFVLKATSTPDKVAEADTDNLRSLGWTDQDMVDAVAHGARAVATNILFDAFKIESDG